MPDLDVPLGIFGVIFVATITPGPNNLIVMSTAARFGRTATIRAISGVVIGTVFILAVAWAGGTVVFEQWPILKTWLRVLGTAFLIGLALQMIFCRDDGENQLTQEKPATFTTTLGLAAFQFLNPKSWILVVLISSGSAGGWNSFAMVAAILCLVSFLCLSLWGAMGSFLSRWLTNAKNRSYFDWTMVGLLSMSALMVMFNV